MKPIVLAASLMFLAVAAGAFGAHALQASLAERNLTHAWDTAVLYQLVHGVALLAVGLWRRVDGAALRSTAIGSAAVLWTLGIVCFSGSLYALALGAPRWVGPVTPLGGLAFLAGWAALAIGAMRLEHRGADPA